MWYSYMWYKFIYLYLNAVSIPTCMYDVIVYRFMSVWNNYVLIMFQTQSLAATKIRLSYHGSNTILSCYI